MYTFKTAVRLCLLSWFAAAAFGQTELLTFSAPTIPNLVVGNETFIDFTSDISGGTAPYILTLTSGTLPTGVSLGVGQLSVSGTPTVPSPAGQPFTFTLTVTDSSTPTPQSASQTISITVVTNPLVIMPAGSLAGGVVGISYGQGHSVYAQGGVPPYNWSITHGTLPASSGLTLNSPTSGQNSSGQPSYAITGTPSTAGTYSFTLQVSDSSSPPQTATQTYTISVINPKSYLAPSSSSYPTGIAATASALWFTQQQGAVGIESITPSGTFQSETSIPASPAVTPIPEAIAAGADGNLWITDQAATYIYRVTPGGNVTPIVVQTSGVPPDLVSPSGITSGIGIDNHVWFTGTGQTAHQGYIGQIATDGTNALNFFKVPQYVSTPTSIVPDPDGTHLWFLAQGGDPASIVVGRIGTDGTFDPPSVCQAHPPVPNFAACFILDSSGKAVPPPGSIVDQTSVGPFIAVGADGGIWFATGNFEIGRINEDGSGLAFFPVAGTIESLLLAPDSALWYTLTPFNNTLGRITSSGQATTFNLPNASANESPQLVGTTVGPDGALWMTDQAGNAIFQVFPSLILNCTGASTLQVGVPITNASCAAVGGKAPYSYSFDTSNLPPGVTVSPSGVLSGTPTAPGSFIITANDSSSPAQQASQVFSIQAAPAVQFTCNFPATGAAGQPYSASCTTTGGNAPYTYTATPNLPAGLTGVASSPSGATGSYGFSVSGTLSQALYGKASFTITASDSSSPPNTSTQSVSINIAPIAVSLSCNPNSQAVVGKAFQQTCFGFRGAPPYAFSATGLPAGLTINSANGVISGIPSATGQSPVSVVVTDAGGLKAIQSITLSVINPRLALLCDLPFNPTTATDISTTCKTDGGVGPYSYSVASGTTLPASLTFKGGVVSGEPTTPGPVTFTLQVSDSESPAVTARQSVSLFVHPAALAILTTTIPVPNPPLPYAVALSVGGGTPPYKFSIDSGALPGGLNLGSSSGVIYSVAGGPSIAAGAFSFSVKVTDSASAKATATQAYAGTVPAAPIAASFNSYALSGPSGANGITVGPDGNLWFTTLDQSGGNLIGRITPSGTITTTAASNALTQPTLATGGDIAAGPDGEIWIAERDGNAVGEVALDLSSQLTYLPPAANSGPGQITAAPDGTLWFTEPAANQIAHVGADGTVVEFPTKSGSSGPYGIAVGPDNFIAFTEVNVNKIGVISEDGLTKVEFPIPTASSLPASIVLGPDSAFWFTELGANKIGRMDFAGNVAEVSVSSAPQAITLGPDGALYFTEPKANKIGRVTIAGALTEITIPDQGSGPTGIVAGPDGSIWFTEANLSKIGRLSFILGPAVSCTLPTEPLPALSTFSGSCTASQGTPPYQFSFSTAAGSVPPPGVSLDPNTGALSGTLTTAGTFAFTVLVTDSTSPPQTGRQSFSFTVSPLPLTLTCNTPTGRLYTLYASASQTNYGCAAVNGTPPYTYAITAGSVPPGLSFDPNTGNITGTPTTLGDYPLTIHVTDSSTPPMVVSQAITISVQYGVVTGKGTQLFTLSTAPLSVAPGSKTPGLTLSVGETLLQAVTGTAVLTFAVDKAIVGLNTPAGYVDPALQFVDASGNPLGASYNFTFPPGTTSITLPAISPGTVLGTVDITIKGAGLPQTATTFAVAGSTPVIEPGSVQFTNVTAGGFDVEFVAMTPTRSSEHATITFNPASGGQIAGQQTFVFDVSAISNGWFASADSLKYGGRYSLTFSFVFNGSVNAIGSATVTLDTSQPVTGNR